MKKFSVLWALLTLPMAAVAGSTTLGDWGIYSGSGSASDYMVTVNESKSMFGKWCDGEACYWMLVAPFSCVTDKMAPVILNFDAAAAAFDVICSGPAPGFAGFYRFTFLTPDRLDTMLAASQNLAIAMPGESGTFRSFRFKVAQSGGAISVLMTESMKRKPAAKDGAL